MAPDSSRLLDSLAAAVLAVAAAACTTLHVGTMVISAWCKQTSASVTQAGPACTFMHAEMMAITS